MAAVWGGSSEPPTVAAVASCRVTIPNGSTPPGERPNPHHHGNGRLWTGLPLQGEPLLSGGLFIPGKYFPNGSPGLHSDGSATDKFYWWGARSASRRLRITGQWATGQGANPVNRTHIPSSNSTNSPYFWFIAYLLARYKPGVAVNALGPQPSGNIYGNPYGAVLTALEPMNEPNLTIVEQNNIGCWAAINLQNAVSYAAAYTSTTSIFGPAFSDIVGAPTGYAAATQQCVQYLNGWRPPSGYYAGWSHHNYQDVKYVQSPGSDNVGNLLSLLSQYGWYDASHVWLTEGGQTVANNGSTFSSDGTQEAHNVHDAYYQARSRYPSNVLTFAQHTVNDKSFALGDSFQSGLRGFYDFTAQAPGPQRPLYPIWQGLQP
jgi:hypothetical protein